MDLRLLHLEKELRFKTSRSGGKGGQNVNKVSTKVELNFNILESELLDEEQKNLLIEKLKHKISKDNVLQIVVQEERSQLANKEIAIEKFYTFLQKSLLIKKKRKPTKISKVKKEKRLQNKKRESEVKKGRKKFTDF